MWIPASIGFPDVVAALSQVDGIIEEQARG
jgi:hypothetical protein